MKALATGATGFIGSHIVDHLLVRGDSVRALVRPDSDTRRLVRQGVRLVYGDLTDHAVLDTAVEGVDVIYHVAALLGKGHSATAMITTNVVGTENLLGACVRQAVSRFVFLSSVSVYAPSSAHLVDEDAPQGETGTYGQSKSAAERIIQHYAQTYGMNYSVLRPCRVYGERDERYTGRLLRILRAPIIPVVSGGWPFYNLVHASDVADAAILAGTRPGALGQTFNITDGQGAFLGEIVEAVRALSGQKQMILPVPQHLAAFAYRLRLVLRARRTRKDRRKDSVRWQRCHLFCAQHFDISKARRDIGYEPQINLQEGLRRAMAWYEQERASCRACMEEACIRSSIAR